jgi:hypothetical protein
MRSLFLTKQRPVKIQEDRDRGMEGRGRREGVEKGVGFSSYDYPKKAKFYADFKSVEIIGNKYT